MDLLSGMQLNYLPGFCTQDNVTTEGSTLVISSLLFFIGVGLLGRTEWNPFEESNNLVCLLYPSEMLDADRLRIRVIT